MNKKLFFFLFFIFAFTELIWAETLHSVEPYCEGKQDQTKITDLDKIKIKNVEVEIFKNKQFTTNSIRILIGNFRFIPDIYKKWFKSKVIVRYENDLKCTYTARVKFHGDQKDHVILKDNSITQSIDVHLRTGNIYGITKFILLLKDTRGQLDDVILLSELLRQFNYLAPRTMFVEAKINGVSSQMIFQEKAVKELLEYNSRREGPILEGDERYLWRLAQKTPSNQLSNHAAGLVPLIKAGFNSMLAKQNNTNFIPRSKKHALMSFNALSNLNVIYLLYSNMYNVSKTNYYEAYRYYTLNNHLLGLHEPKNILKLDVYNLLVQSATGYHGLVPNNRKFYWNAFEGYFEPINYDSKFNIDKEPEHLLLPVSNQIIDAFSRLESLLNKSDVSELNKQLNFRGIDISVEETAIKIKKLKSNLNKLNDIYLNYDKGIIEHNNVYKIDSSMWNKYFNSIQKVNPEVILVKQNKENNSFEVCKKLLNCRIQNFSDDQISELLDGDLIINSIEYQYLGKNTEINDLLISTKYKKIKFQDSYFYFDENIKYKNDEEKKEFNIFQTKPGARAFFHKGMLKNLNINFHGYEYEKNKQPPNFPIDQRGLTGCLSLINLNVENVSIKSDNSDCEDTVNIVDVKGSFNEINIKNSFSDGLDVDFSKVEIESINISSSGNDCVDFSAGNYKLNKLNLINCGDKALSVGEKSSLMLNEIVAENSNIGIASKDSSITKLNYAYLKNLETCLSAYNKKQEFFGGIIEAEKLECENYNKKTESDINSKIIVAN